eukprot:gene2613-3238_t
MNNGEFQLAKQLLRKTEPMNYLKLNYPDRYLRLEHYLQKEFISLEEFYKINITTEKRRKEIADSLTNEITTVPPSRLMNLLTDSLKWQQHKGNIPLDCLEYDLFLGKVPSADTISEDDRVPNTLDKIIKFSTKNKPECCRFTPDSRFLVTGSVDGFVEIWDYNTGKLSKALTYQSNDEFMMHDDAILCLNFSKDGEYLATGSMDKGIKVWQIKTGKCLRKFEPAHTSGVTCVAFSKNATQILSGSFDSSLKIHGLKSGKSLRIFRGHQSFINDCCFTNDEERVISCSSDGKIKIWDAKSADCLQTLSPTQTVNIKDISIKSIQILQKHQNFIVICNSSPFITIMSMDTQKITKTFTTNNNKNFLCFTLSQQQKYIYAVSEDNHLYSFDIEKGTIVDSFKIHDQEVIGIAQHPQRNIVATFGIDSLVKLWKPIPESDQK